MVKYLAIIYGLDGSVTTHTFWQHSDESAAQLCREHIHQYNSIELQTFDGHFVKKLIMPS